MPWIIGGAVLGAGLLGGGAQHSANQSNVNAQRRNNAFQKELSDTAYRRAVGDMKAAGLNPMLAYSQGGASTPSTSAATVEPVDAPSKALSSAAGAFQNIRLTAEQADLTHEKVEQEKIVTDKLKGHTNTMTDPWDNRYRRELEETEQAQLNTRIKRIETQIAEETGVSSARAKQQILDKEVDIAEAKKILLQLDIPERRALAEWFENIGSASPAMKAIMTVGQWLKYILGGK